MSKRQSLASDLFNPIIPAYLIGETCFWSNRCMALTAKNSAGLTHDDFSLNQYG
jgi:hypothetical protein